MTKEKEEFAPIDNEEKLKAFLNDKKVAIYFEISSENSKEEIVGFNGTNTDVLYGIYSVVKEFALVNKTSPEIILEALAQVDNLRCIRPFVVMNGGKFN